MHENRKLKFSQWLKKALTESGLSQSALARASKVSKQHINGFLALAEGRQTQRISHPSIEVVDALAQALRASLNEARYAAGYAAAQEVVVVAESRLMEYYNALPPDRQRDLLDHAEMLYRKYGNAEVIEQSIEQQQKAA